MPNDTGAIHLYSDASPEQLDRDDQQTSWACSRRKILPLWRPAEDADPLTLFQNGCGATGVPRRQLPQRFDLLWLTRRSQPRQDADDTASLCTDAFFLSMSSLTKRYPAARADDVQIRPAAPDILFGKDLKSFL
jgi:hypothetical protein